MDSALEAVLRKSRTPIVYVDPRDLEKMLAALGDGNADFTPDTLFVAVEASTPRYIVGWVDVDNNPSLVGGSRNPLLFIYSRDRHRLLLFAIRAGMGESYSVGSYDVSVSVFDDELMMREEIMQYGSVIDTDLMKFVAPRNVQLTRFARNGGRILIDDTASTMPLPIDSLGHWTPDELIESVEGFGASLPPSRTEYRGYGIGIGIFLSPWFSRDTDRIVR